MHYSSDFFNNIAAIAVVLMLIKVVSHRSREVRTKWSQTRAILHVVAVISAAIAIITSLIATYKQSAAYGLFYFASAGLAFTALILIADIIVGEFSDAPAVAEDVGAAGRAGRPETTRGGGPVRT